MGDSGQEPCRQRREIGSFLSSSLVRGTEYHAHCPWVFTIPARIDDTQLHPIIRGHIFLLANQAQGYQDTLCRRSAEHAARAKNHLRINGG
jgi:hypothetical protein